ncbi:MAG: PAS domain S-box protein [Bacteroidota bacterium]
MEEDKRLLEISEHIVRLANADFTKPGEVSEKGDDLDSIVIGLNLIGEELESYIKQLNDSQDKIKQSLSQLAEAQRLAHIGSWEMDVATKKVEWSNEMYNVYGYGDERFEVNYESARERMLPEDIAPSNAKMERYVKEALLLFKEKQSLEFAIPATTYPIILPDGSRKILRGLGKIILNTNGHIAKMVGTVQDVTELTNAEEKARMLAAIVESSNDAIISKTLDGKITSWNQQAEKLFGFTEEEILGKHISIVFPEERLNEEEEILKNIKEGNPLIAYETERKRKDGSRVSVSATISPIKDATGKIIGASKIVRDITEKKLAEEKLVAYTNALEQKNSETEQFAYIASHDLQEPLRTITNYIGLFYDDYKGKLDESADIYLDFISGASKRMQVLITDLLEYTRIEKDKHPIDINLNELVNEILKDLNNTITENHAQLDIGTLPIISGYATRIKSLFQNLIINAIKFKKPDVSPVVKITATDLGKEWRFEITDNGIGIEEIYHDKIFKLFQRLHTRKEYKGTGIGLAHCKKIVDLAGGKIWVESELGKGSMFCFLLPKKIVL